MMENKIYNPAGQPKEWLIEHFVVRTKVFEKIFKDISKGKMKYPPQHYLIQGQRGMGKTTLLLRLKYEIENTPELNDWLIPAFFSEETYDLTSLSNLWEKLLKYLDDLWETNGVYYKKTDEFLGKEDYEKECFDLLIGALHSKKQKLVVFFDNFGQLFLDNLSDNEQHRLREILMNCADMRIVGASAVVMEDLYDYSKPFFEFFKIINLEGLTKDETLELINKFEEKSDTKVDIEKHKGKIETLAILTGGVIRTIMLIYEVILTDQDGTALRDLEIILDRITPLYKHRIEDLPPQQRKIVNVIAKKWDAISTKEIAQSIRENGQNMDSKLISAQLQQLEKNNIIEKKQTNTKNHLYQVKERFFNIWYLMRNGDRYDRCRVIWLTKFLELFYDDGFDGFLKEHVKHLRSGNYHPNSALMISEALANSKKLDVMSKDLVLKETALILSNEQKRLLPDITKSKLELYAELFKQEKTQEAIKVLDSIENKNNQIKLHLALNYSKTENISPITEIIQGIIPANVHEKYAMGILYYRVKNYGEAIKLIKEYDGPKKGEAYYFIAESLSRIGKINESIEFFKKSIEFEYPHSYRALVEQLFRTNQKGEALKYCLEAINKDVAGMEAVLAEIYIFPPSNNLDQEKGLNLVKEELKKRPQDPILHYLLGVYYYINVKFIEAKELFLKVHGFYEKTEIELFHYYMNLMFLFDLLIESKDKAKMLEILDENKEGKLSGFYLYRLHFAFAKIWDNQHEKAINEFLTFLEAPIVITETENLLIQNVLLLLIAKKQYHSALKLFQLENYNLKDKFKPIYYTLMQYMKDEFPNEHLRMGEELVQPVNDLMKKVEQMSIDYA